MDRDMLETNDYLVERFFGSEGSINNITLWTPDYAHGMMFIFSFKKSGLFTIKFYREDNISYYLNILHIEKNGIKKDIKNDATAILNIFVHENDTLVIDGKNSSNWGVHMVYAGFLISDSLKFAHYKHHEKQNISQTNAN